MVAHLIAGWNGIHWSTGPFSLEDVPAGCRYGQARWYDVEVTGQVEDVGLARVDVACEFRLAGAVEGGGEAALAIRDVGVSLRCRRLTDGQGTRLVFEADRALHFAAERGDVGGRRVVRAATRN